MPPTSPLFLSHRRSIPTYPAPLITFRRSRTLSTASDSSGRSNDSPDPVSRPRASVSSARSFLTFLGLLSSLWASPCAAVWLFDSTAPSGPLPGESSSWDLSSTSSLHRLCPRCVYNDIVVITLSRSLRGRCCRVFHVHVLFVHVHVHLLLLLIFVLTTSMMISWRSRYCNRYVVVVVTLSRSLPSAATTPSSSTSLSSSSITTTTSSSSS